jgi:hypothetical protein
MGGPSLQSGNFGGPANFTVQFSVSALQAWVLAPAPPHVDPTVTPGNVTPTAELQWAIGGNIVRRLISVQNGTSITGVAESVIVNVNDLTDSSDTSNLTQYKVGITLAPGVRASYQTPPVLYQYMRGPSAVHSTYGFFALNGGELLYVPVPENAGITSVMAMVTHSTPSVPATSFIFRQMDSIPNTLKEYNPNAYDFVALNTQAKFIHCQNLLPVGNLTHFFITWGIDG